jgi:GDP/UDP-N,N'-diacetylbacillosamine 2-epimerase (hydrolysing)
MKKICVITGTRAEYGLLRWVMEGIRSSPSLELQLIVTGMHLSHEFGLTVKAIEADGFIINRKIEMLLSSDTSVGITKSMGLGIIGFADALEELHPHLVLILGDRYEIFAAAASAMMARILIAHIHGGESTEGLIDEQIRHSITKMSHLHFVAADQYKKRVIQLGEQPEYVYHVGGLGIDSIARIKLFDRKMLEEILDFKLRERNLLITFHPVTLEINSAKSQIEELLSALQDLGDTGLIFTMPNADAEGREIFSAIKKFCDCNVNARFYTSLGQQLYLSCIQHTDGVIGNSSSGLTEVPIFKKGTINIGNRQNGRLKANSVIDCSADRKSIGLAISKLFSHSFQDTLSATISPYGSPGASERIVNILEKIPFNSLLKKSFYDVNIK